MHQEPDRGVWLSWRLAVERRRGWSWGKAAKAIDDACAKGELRWRHRFGGGPDISEADFLRWLNPPKPELGKQPLIIKYLAEKFPGQRVPDPAHCVRKDLLAELRKSDPLLKSLDYKTLCRAISKYHLSLDGKQS
jgi:hypothetical protein